MFYPDSAFRRDVGQRQRTAYRESVYPDAAGNISVVSLRALGTDRRFHDMQLGSANFVRLNAVTERVQFQLGHDNYPRRVAVKPFGRRTSSKIK